MQLMTAVLPARGAAVGLGPCRISQKIFSLCRIYASTHEIGLLHQQLSSSNSGTTFAAHQFGSWRQVHSNVSVDKTQSCNTWSQCSKKGIRWTGLAAAVSGVQIFCLQTSSGEAAGASEVDSPHGRDVKQPEEKEGETAVGAAEAVGNKPESCTADELHFVAVPNTDWRLALWRYRPPPGVPVRNHPVLMLSGIGTNAIGFDLAPSVSMSRYLASAGFDTWVLEVRGAGLGTREGPAPIKSTEQEHRAAKQEGNAEFDALFSDSLSSGSKTDEDGAVEKLEASKQVAKQDNGSSPGGSVESVSKLSDTIWVVLERLRGLVNQGQARFLSAKFLEQLSSVWSEEHISGRISEFRRRLSELVEEAQNSVIANELADRRNKLAKLLEEAQSTFSPRISDLQERMGAIVDEYQKVLDMIGNFDWDFDNYLEEDVPAAIEYVLKVSKSVDGKVIGIGHSMGGILLYATLATQGDDAKLAAVVTIASSLDYGGSDSSLKLLLPLADPSRILNVPVVPLGALMTAVHPLVTKPPYALAFIGHQMSANGNMDPELFNKLVLHNFGTIPVKLLLHMSTAFKPGGLRNRDNTVFYKDCLKNSKKIPVLALAGDQDPICPPSAVLDTVEAMPQDIVKYMEFKGYAHYDLLVSRKAREEVYPVILKFLLNHDVPVDGDYQPVFEGHEAFG